MSKLRKPAAIAVLALVAILAVEGAALAAAVGRNGKAVTAVRTLTSQGGTNFTTTNWIDVPDMKLFVTVPKDQKAILVITYSADTMCSGNASYGAVCLIRVTVDGQDTAPGGVQWSYNYANETPESGVASMQWVAGPLSPGDHQVKVQASIGNANNTFWLGQQTLTVLRSRF